MLNPGVQAPALLQHELNIFLQATPPTETLVQQVNALLQQQQDLTALRRKQLNDFVDWANRQLLHAGGHNSNVLEDEVEQLVRNLTKVTPRASTCFVDNKWKNVVLFHSTPYKVLVFSGPPLKECSFGEIKRGVLVRPSQSHPGHFEASVEKVALKVSKQELSNVGKRITGEEVFENADKEMAIMRMLAQHNHPNILNVLALGKDDDGLVYTLMPLGKYSLADKLTFYKGQIPELLANLRRLLREIGSALDLFHSLGFAHRDISLENILEMDDGSLRLIDFGLGCSLTLDNAQNGKWMNYGLDTRNGRVYASGKPRYLAPEIYRQGLIDLHNFRYDVQKADVFSLGLCLFALTYNALPYHTMFPEAGLQPTTQQLQAFWNQPNVEAHLFQCIADHPLLEAMTMMLQIDPEQRWTARQCVNAA